jgi:tripartite-type tricarboxylate transporter receptor subunit TctC
MRAALLIAIVGCAVCGTLSAQGYPARPIRMIVPSAPGGLPDIQSRVVASQLSAQLGQQVVVDNRPGASSMIGFELMARAPADGYTLGYATFPIATNPSVYKKLGYDALRDFEFVVHQVSALNILAVSPALPIHSVKDLVEFARAHPNKLSFGNTGYGASNFLSIELLKQMTGVRLVPVQYKAIQQATTDAIAGQIHVVCDNLGSILPHVRSARMRGLGVTSLKRSPIVPDLPTVDEAGVPGFEITPWSGYVLPARTPKEVVLRLNAELNKALKSPPVTEKMAAIGSHVVGGTPGEFAAHLRRETEKWARVVKSAGINPQ